MTTSSIPNETEQGDSGESPRPSFLDRIFGNQFVLLGLLLTLLGWVALTRIWLFVLIVAIVASVFLHEMGHFLMAKRNGMKVTEFFIGFGPRVWSFRRGETEYGLKLVPAGAYVRIIGMHGLEELDESDEEARVSEDEDVEQVDRERPSDADLREDDSREIEHEVPVA
jgi:hypothetical protein